MCIYRLKLYLQTKTASNCMFKLTRVNRIKHLLDKKTLIYLINAFVFSKLFYCSTVWSSTSKKNVRKLQLVLIRTMPAES